MNIKAQVIEKPKCWLNAMPPPEWFSCPVCRLSWSVDVVTKGYGTDSRPFVCAEDRVRLMRGGPEVLPPPGTEVPKWRERPFLKFSPDVKLALQYLERR